MASPGGYSKIVYPDGCIVEVKPRTVVVQETSPCKTGGLSATTFVVGTTLVGGTVAVIVLASNNNDNKPRNKKSNPASP